MVDIYHSSFVRYTTPEEVAIRVADIYGDVVVMCENESESLSTYAAKVSKEFTNLIQRLDRKVAEQHTIAEKK